MKTAAFDSSFDTPFDIPFDTPFDTPFGSELLARLSLARDRVGAATVVEPEPVGWRSEAFAEDLADLIPAAAAGGAPRRPWLRLALAAVLRRR